MIEDALKSTRTSQRLLLLASCIAIVFLSSLEDVRLEERLLRDLGNLSTLDLDSYVDFVGEMVKLNGTPMFARRASRVRREIEHHIRQIYDTEVLGGRLLVNAFHGDAPGMRKFTEFEMSDTITLAQVRAFYRELPLASPIRVLVTDEKELTRKLIRDLDDAYEIQYPQLSKLTNDAEIRQLPNYASLEISNVSCITDYNRNIIPDAKVVYFLRLPRSPFSVRRELITEAAYWPIPGSSWSEWFKEKHAESFVTIEGRDVDGKEVTMPLVLSAASLPINTHQPLIEVRADLERVIEEHRAANRTIDLAGISIPGGIGLYGIPLVLLGVGTSFLLHLRHLGGLLPQNRQPFTEFSWSPLAPDQLWLFVTPVVVLVLPITACLLVALRAHSFGSLELYASAVGITSAVCQAALGAIALRAIFMIRKRLYSSR